MSVTNLTLSHSYNHIFTVTAHSISTLVVTNFRFGFLIRKTRLTDLKMKSLSLGVLFVVILCAEVTLAHRYGWKKTKKDGQGTEHFYRGKLFHHQLRNVLGSPLNHSIGDPSKVQTLWFDQTLDHFSPADTRTWKQVNNSFSFSCGLMIRS